MSILVIRLNHVVNFITHNVNGMLLFPVWYYVYSWGFWYKTSTRVLVLVYDLLGVGPILGHLIAPFRRDRSFAGYFVGIAIRVVWVLASSVILAVIFLVGVGLVAGFYLGPVALVYFRYAPMLIPYFLFWLVWYVFLLFRQQYWDNVLKGNLSSGLARQVWQRLELDPGEADRVYTQSKEAFVTYLKKHDLNENDFLYTKEWVLHRELNKQAWKFWRDENFVRRKGVNIGWVAGFLPELKSFSIDLTQRAATGHLPHIFGRSRELEQILTVLRRPSGNNVLLVGEAGVGKTSMVYALSWLILGRRTGIELEHIDAMIKPLEGRRVIELNAGGMIGRAGGGGALMSLFNEVLRELKEGETVLFVNQVENLLQAGLIGYLTPLLSSKRFPVIATTTRRVFKESLEDLTEFVSQFEVIYIDPPSVSETVRILEGVVGDLESKHGVFFTYPSLRTAVELSERYIHNMVLPEKAIKVLIKAAENTRGKIQKADAEAAISSLSGVPVGDLSAEESDKLLDLEQLLKKQIIGQDEAVREIARAIRRARTGIGSKERPIASLLFLGSTGVGKTLTAQTLAQVYFTPKTSLITSSVELRQMIQKNFIRFDMTEFSEYGAVSQFVERIVQEVKARPFALILLDEFEKAEGHIHNLFLQIFEDGRLTSEDGGTADFRNTIIIATSNAVQEVPANVEKSAFIQEKLLTVFRPELVNRFDGIVLFHTLTQQDMQQVVVLELGKLKARLREEHEITLSWTDQLVAELSRLGYDPEYGARPLRRIIQDRIEDTLAQRILRKQLQNGDEYELGVGDLQ